VFGLGRHLPNLRCNLSALPCRSFSCTPRRSLVLASNPIQAQSSDSSRPLLLNLSFSFLFYLFLSPPSLLSPDSYPFTLLTMTLQDDNHPASSNPSSTTHNPSTVTTAQQDASGRQPSAASSTSAQLSGAKVELRKVLRSFPDFPIPGIDFVDIMPLFANPAAHATLVSALELQIAESFPGDRPDVIVGLDARGFLFGPGLALKLGIGFAAVRKQGKLPGPCVTAEYVKEYGKDLFQMQEDAIQEGQKVLIVDDIIATGGSAKAAADLVQQRKGQVMGYLFILEIPGLNGRDKLEGAPASILMNDA
jgi:adenine phosphoribosyltransferase